MRTKILHTLATIPSHHLKRQKNTFSTRLKSRKIYFSAKLVQWASEKSIAWKHTNALTVD